MAKKLSFQTKATCKKCMVCSYCESACNEDYKINHGTLYMGQKPSVPRKIDYFCNRPCQVAFGLQEQSIYLRTEIADYSRAEQKIKTTYCLILNDPERYNLGKETTSSILSSIGLYKHLRLFYEGLLARKSTEELHLLRMKAKKYAGEMLEHSMVIQQEECVDSYSSIMQGDLADEENYHIDLFARD